MLTLNPRKLARFFSVVVMVVLMFTFVQAMGRSYFASMQCITDMSASCQEQSVDNTQFAAMPGDSNQSTDEWLCANGETAYCGKSQVTGIEVVQLKND